MVYLLHLQVTKYLPVSRKHIDSNTTKTRRPTKEMSYSRSPISMIYDGNTACIGKVIAWA